LDQGPPVLVGILVKKAIVVVVAVVALMVNRVGRRNLKVVMRVVDVAGDQMTGDDHAKERVAHEMKDGPGMKDGRGRKGDPRRKVKRAKRNRVRKVGVLPGAKNAHMTMDANVLHAVHGKKEADRQGMNETHEILRKKRGNENHER
jgi:hypothetical protein